MLKSTLAWPTALALLAGAVFCPGCTTARVAVDPALASADHWTVEGANPRAWNTPVAFGPWRSGPVRDAGRLGWSVEVLKLGVGASRRPVAFTLTSPEETIDAECHEQAFEAWTASGWSVDLQAALDKPALVCAFRVAGREGGGAPATWRFALGHARTATGGYVGELRDEGGSAAFVVRSSDRLDGTALRLGAPAGYTFERGGAPVGLVEVLNAGAVWLPASGTPRGPLAAASTALLLFRPAGS